MYVSLGSGTIYSDLLLFRRQSFFMTFEVNTIAILRLFLSAQNIMTYLFSNRRAFVHGLCGKCNRSTTFASRCKSVGVVGLTVLTS